MDNYQQIHDEVIRRIRSDGGIPGLEYFNEHRGVYDANTQGLNGKLQIIGAIEGKHNLLGIRLKLREQYRGSTTGETIDGVLETLPEVLRLFERASKGKIPALDGPFQHIKSFGEAFVSDN